MLEGSYVVNATAGEPSPVLFAVGPECIRPPASQWASARNATEPVNTGATPAEVPVKSNLQILKWLMRASEIASTSSQWRAVQVNDCRGVDVTVRLGPRFAKVPIEVIAGQHKPLSAELTAVEVRQSEIVSARKSAHKS